MLDIINDVLDLPRIEAGKANLQPAPVDVQKTVHDCLKLISGKISENGQTVSQKLSIPDQPFVVDTRMLKQMLLNLLSNANKFRPEGGRLRSSRKQQVMVALQSL